MGRVFCLQFTESQVRGEGRTCTVYSRWCQESGDLLRSPCPHQHHRHSVLGYSYATSRLSSALCKYTAQPLWWDSKQPKDITSFQNVQWLKEGNVLFNDALNTFYLRLYGVRHMVKNHSDSERGSPLPPHGLRFTISRKDSFICTIPDTETG